MQQQHLARRSDVTPLVSGAAAWRRLDSAWKYAVFSFLVVRVGLTIWSLAILYFFPVVLKNLDLFGSPVLVTFDSTSGERFVYSRAVAGTPLTFRAGAPGYVIDAQTGSVWSLREGRAVSGPYSGRMLNSSAYSAEDVFPYHGASAETNSLLGAWQRFDANWYLAIAATGYAAPGSTVYMPLYPVLIRIAGVLTGDPLLAALLVSNLALIGALALLYRLAAVRSGEASARRMLVYLLVFPTAFFLLGAYTESLFLLLVLAAFACADKRQWLAAAFFGSLAALTRLQGALLIVPLAYMWWRGADRRGFSGAFLLLIPVASAAFLVATNLSLLSAYQGTLHARFVLPWDNVAAAVGLLASGKGTFADALNLAAALGLGVMLIAVWRDLPREYGLYAVLMFLAPLVRMTATQPLVSMARYALAIFPVFFLWGAWGRNPWVNRALIYLSFPLWLFLSAQFVLWGWVG